MNIDADIRRLKSQVLALRRKLARPIAQLVIQRMADELCLEWSCATAQQQPPPDPPTFIFRLARAGLRLPTFTAGSRYLTSCIDEGTEPLPERILRALLPWATPYPPPAYAGDGSPTA